LEKLRYGDRLDLNISISGDIENYQIAPFLLLPFLENAFKHGTSKQLAQCWINLETSMESSIMNFKLANSLDVDKNVETEKIGGLGLQNVKRRLELLYKDKYKLDAKLLKETFVVDLQINLEELDKRYIEGEKVSPPEKVALIT
jgi:sensor histidine kinase YesM